MSFGQIYTSTTHPSADFFALQSSVTPDATDYIGTSPACRSAIQRRFPAVLKRDGLAVSNHVLYVGQPIFWPKSLKFWLYNLQVLTLFWAINFLRLQLQNNSALDVEVNPEVYSCTLSFEIKKKLFNFGDGILISTLITTVESNLRTS